MSRFATMINKEFTVPEEVAAQVRHLPAGMQAPAQPQAAMTGLNLTMFRLSQWLKSPKPYLMITGFAILLGVWYFAVEVWKLPRFKDMPGLTVVFREWFSKDPTYGLSLYTPEYYQHIWVSVRRIRDGDSGIRASSISQRHDDLAIEVTNIRAIKAKGGDR